MFTVITFITSLRVQLRT